MNTRKSNIPWHLVGSEAMREQNELHLRAIAESLATDRDRTAHLPVDAACKYHEVEAYREQYGEHVGACAFCQSLIDTMQPDPALLK